VQRRDGPERLWAVGAPRRGRAARRWRVARTLQGGQTRCVCVPLPLYSLCEVHRRRHPLVRDLELTLHTALSSPPRSAPHQPDPHAPARTRADGQPGRPPEGLAPARLAHRPGALARSLLSTAPRARARALENPRDALRLTLCALVHDPRRSTRRASRSGARRRRTCSGSSSSRRPTGTTRSSTSCVRPFPLSPSLLLVRRNEH